MATSTVSALASHLAAQDSIFCQVHLITNSTGLFFSPETRKKKANCVIKFVQLVTTSVRNSFTVKWTSKLNGFGVVVVVGGGIAEVV